MVPADFELQMVQYEEDQQYKLHWDAELTPFNLVTEIVRYVTGLLYLAEPDVGGETLLPLADGEPPRYRCNLGCILLKMAAISSLAGWVRRGPCRAGGDCGSGGRGPCGE